jgi:hypothetical protein
MTTTTHNPNITVNVFLDPSPAPEAGFGIVLLLVPKATNSLNSERVATYTSYDDAVTDNTAGHISAGSLAAVEAAFAQRPKPSSFKLGNVDLVGGETYATGLAAVIAVDDDFYGVCLSPRTDAEIVLVSAYVEASSKKMLCAFQSDDASWLTAGIPAGLSAIEDNEQTIANYHDDDTAWMDVATLVNRLRFDPDDQSAPWHGYAARGVADYAAVPSAAERLLVIANNCNLGLPYGGQDFVIDPGVNMTGRAIDEILSADWFSTRLQERTAALVVEHGERGEKIVIDKTGQKKVLAVIEGLLAAGVSAGHFVVGQTEAIAETITSADRDARTMRFTVRAQLAVSARLFTFNCYFSRDPIADDA